MKKKFLIPVTWEVYDEIEIEANSLEEAVKYAIDNRGYTDIKDIVNYLHKYCECEVKTLQSVVKRFKINGEEDLNG